MQDCRNLLVYVCLLRFRLTANGLVRVIKHTRSRKRIDTFALNVKSYEKKSFPLLWPKGAYSDSVSKVYVNAISTKFTEGFWMKFGTQIIYNLDKDILYYLNLCGTFPRHYNTLVAKKKNI